MTKEEISTRNSLGPEELSIATEKFDILREILCPEVKEEILSDLTQNVATLSSYRLGIYNLQMVKRFKFHIPIRLSLVVLDVSSLYNIKHRTFSDIK